MSQIEKLPEKQPEADKQYSRPVEITDVNTRRIINPHLVGFLTQSSGFFTAIVRNLDKVCTRSLPTLGVSFDKKLDRFILYWNPDFVEKTVNSGNAILAGLGDTWMRNILLHEMLHIALSHCTARARKPHFLWNVATDLSINYMIVGNDKHSDGNSSLPDGCLIPGKKMKKEDGSFYQRGVDDDFACDLAQAISEMPPALLSELYFEALCVAFKDKIEKANKESGEGGDGDQKDGQGGKGPGPLDSHDHWIVSEDGQGSANGEASDENREYVEQRVKDLLRKAAVSADQSSNGWGCIPAEIREKIRSFIGGEVDWRNLLAQWTNGRIRGEKHSTIRRVNKRYPMIHPGSKRSHRPLLLVAKDQSGSVSNEAVATFFAELTELSKNCDFDTVSFDTECGDVTRWHAGSIPECTREKCGGTDFESVVRLMELPENHGRWDGVIMLTDGECSKPSPSPVSRVWIICPGHKLMFQPDDCETVIELSLGKSADKYSSIG